jgi:hypothetical protein
MIVKFMRERRGRNGGFEGERYSLCPKNVNDKHTCMIIQGS